MIAVPSPRWRSSAATRAMPAMRGGNLSSWTCNPLRTEAAHPGLGRLTPLLLRQRPGHRRIEQAETLRREQVVCARAVLVLDEVLDAQTGGGCALGECPALGDVVDHGRSRVIGCSVGSGITGSLEGRRKCCNQLCSRRQMGAPVHLPQDAIG